MASKIDSATVIFQKISDQEYIILQVLDHLEK